MNKLCLTLLPTLLFIACDDNSESTDDSGSTSVGQVSGASDTDSAGPLDPLCEACTEQSPAGSPNYTCSEQIETCGTYYDVGPDDVPFAFCQGDEFDEPDCETVEEHNAEVVACALLRFGENAEFSVLRERIEAVILSYERRFHSDGERALDIVIDYEDLDVAWEPVRVVAVPDISSCSEQSDASTQWACIEAAFDAAGEQSSCYQSGSFTGSE